MNSVEIEILGKKYRLRHNDPVQIQEYTKYLNTLLDDITSKYNILDNKESLVLVAMILVEKLFELTEESKQLRQELDGINSKIASFFGELT